MKISTYTFKLTFGNLDQLVPYKLMLELAGDVEKISLRYLWTRKLNKIYKFYLLVILKLIFIS